MHYTFGLFWRNALQRLGKLMYYSSHKVWSEKKNEAGTTGSTENTDDELRISSKRCMNSILRSKANLRSNKWSLGYEKCWFMKLFTPLSSSNDRLPSVNRNQGPKKAVPCLLGALFTRALWNSHSGGRGEGLLAVLFSPPLLSNFSHNDKAL